MNNRDKLCDKGSDLTMNFKKILCLFLGHKRIGYSIEYGFSNVERTKCKRCGTELQFLFGKGIIGEWKPYQEKLKKLDFFVEFHEEPLEDMFEDAKRSHSIWLQKNNTKCEENT